MPDKRTDPALGLPYRSADHTDVRHTWAAAISAQVPQLRACDLCLHSGLQPVRIVRSAGEACGPGARHLDMASWRAA